MKPSGLLLVLGIAAHSALARPVEADTASATATVSVAVQASAPASPPASAPDAPSAPGLSAVLSFS
jgi:hypothetical protein